MKIDSAIREFSERYDRDAIQSIDNISQDPGLVLRKKTIDVFNIKESFDKFQEFISGYANYKIQNMNNESATPQSLICEHTEKFIDKDLFSETETLYSNLPVFVETYITGVQTLLNLSDSLKTSMFEAGVDSDSIGDINNFMDSFMNKLHESFDPTMDRILWASGYHSNKKLARPARGTEIKMKPVFL